MYVYAVLPKNIQSGYGSIIIVYSKQNYTSDNAEANPNMNDSYIGLGYAHLESILGLHSDFSIYKK